MVSPGKIDQMTPPFASYIGSEGLANEIWQISRQNSPDNRPSGALPRAKPGTLMITLEAPHGCRG